tara:strand:+ start:2274 stop:2909 length:636 start_codon:yes stop_codon:yes gene_type:complete
MAVAANKRSVMTLFSGANDLYSHQARIVLAEKGVVAEVVEVEPDDLPEELMELNPYNTVPTLVDRDLVLYESRIIMEYLDERFPHPPLMPVYPVARASSRLMMSRILKDWYSLAAMIYAKDNMESHQKQLQESLLSVSSVFGNSSFFMSDEFSLLDCYIAPLLWRLAELGVQLEGQPAHPIHTYMKQIFNRQSFKASLTDVERDIGLGFIL